MYLFQHDKLQAVSTYKGGGISIYSLPLYEGLYMKVKV
jgi:hypothetical protein